MPRFKKSTGSEKVNNKPHDFAAGIQALQVAGWTQEDIQRFFEEAHARRQDAQDVQRAYEAGLTPEQRGTYRDHFSADAYSTLVTYDENKEKEIRLRNEVEKVATSLMDRYHTLADRSDLTNKTKWGLDDTEFIVGDETGNLRKKSVGRDETIRPFGILLDKAGKFSVLQDKQGKEILEKFVHLIKENRAQLLKNKSSNIDMFGSLIHILQSHLFKVSFHAIGDFFEDNMNNAYFDISPLLHERVHPKQINQKTT